MPELPEIETICRSLRFLKGREIEEVSLSSLAPVEKTDPEPLLNVLRHSSLQGIHRRGKYLLLSTSRGNVVLHLGMTGQLRFFSGALPPLSHVHLTLRFHDQSHLLYIDPRRFGTLSLSQEKSGEDNPFLTRLGPDYDDPRMTPDLFIERCRRHDGLSLKSMALHQGIAAGLGNIYACETLYRAALSPRRRVRRTRDHELIQFLAS